MAFPSLRLTLAKKTPQNITYGKRRWLNKLSEPGNSFDQLSIIPTERQVQQSTNMQLQCTGVSNVSSLNSVQAMKAVLAVYNKVPIHL